MFFDFKKNIHAFETRELFFKNMGIVCSGSNDKRKGQKVGIFFLKNKIKKELR